MEWKLDVPKILHVYWGGGSLSYIRYLTVKTFQKHNPDWEIRFYYPTHPTMVMTWHTPEQKTNSETTDFTQHLMNDANIQKFPIDFEKFGYPNTMSEVHKSDIIRLVLLSTVGGLWSDMDIFYFKPMSWFYLNDEKYKHIDTFYCNREYGHSVGFLMATPGNKFFGELLNQSRSFFHSHMYQTFGAALYNRQFRPDGEVEKITPNAINISMDVVYSHRAGDTKGLLTDMKPNFTKHSLGIHWFGGDNAWKDFLVETDGGLKNIPENTIIGKLITGENEIMKYITDLNL